MNNWIIIPVKQVSKRLPRKNWGRMLGGMSLLERAIRVAKQTGATVIVSTSSQALLQEAKRFGVKGVFRSPETDEWDLFDVVRHVITTCQIPATDRVTLLQCTNPFVTLSKLQRCVNEDLLPVMAVQEAGAFYGQRADAWENPLFDDRNGFFPVVLSPSVDIDTAEDFEKAKRLMG